ncbi:hypothetical protein L345_06428, partial [Ophiophagus hannah]
MVGGTQTVGHSPLVRGPMHGHASSFGQAVSEGVHAISPFVCASKPLLETLGNSARGGFYRFGPVWANWMLSFHLVCRTGISTDRLAPSTLPRPFQESPCDAGKYRVCAEAMEGGKQAFRKSGNGPVSGFWWASRARGRPFLPSQRTGRDIQNLGRAKNGPPGSSGRLRPPWPCPPSNRAVNRCSKQVNNEGLARDASASENGAWEVLMLPSEAPFSQKRSLGRPSDVKLATTTPASPLRSNNPDAALNEIEFDIPILENCACAYKKNSAEREIGAERESAAAVFARHPIFESWPSPFGLRAPRFRPPHAHSRHQGSDGPKAGCVEAKNRMQRLKMEHAGATIGDGDLYRLKRLIVGRPIQPTIS